MDQKTSRLESQLCQAVKNGDPRSVQLLLSQGACPDLVGIKGAAAIHLAVGRETERNTRCLKLLLQHGADPNVKSSEGLTPLHIAAVWGCYQNLKLLLTNGGNPKIKDNDGNTPRQLAEQQENRKCALLLQEYQGSSADKNDDDFPQFQYSLYSDQTDTSGYPESDHSYISNSSIMSDFGEAVLSSTRRSSLLAISHMNGRPGCRVVSDIETKACHLNCSSSAWRPDCPSILSSTRVSAAGSVAPLQVIKEHQLDTNVETTAVKAKQCSASSDGKDSPSRRDTLPAFHRRQIGHKSVSFRDVDEYFPVFSPEAPGVQPDGRCPGFDLSEYSDFLDTERMATVLPQQGIDVTSPDHVYVFFRESSESTEEDMEKTVMSRFPLEESDREKDTDPAKDAASKKVASPPVGSSSSGTGSSHYSSCDSDHYTSALDASVHPRGCLVSDGEESSAGAEPDRNTKISSQSEQQCSRSDVQTEAQDEKNTEPLTDVGDAFDSPGKKPRDSNEDKTCTTSMESGIDQPGNGAAEDNFDLTLTHSPFVTGRTRSRMTRYSLRKSKTPESLLFTSSLFDDSLPTPVRTRRQTPRAQSTEDLYSSPRAPCYIAGLSDTTEDSLSADWQDTKPSTLGPGSSVGNSQADTLILSKSTSDSVETQTLSDTVVLEKNEDSSVSTYERNLADVILAMRGQALTEDEDLLTDDLTSAEEAAPNQKLKDGVESLSEDAWISEESQSDSASASSSSSCFSPRGSSENSDIPCTPGTGCTPRYSMSRLSSCSRPQPLANLSYTPGGRPHILDLEEPVEYLYTDTEQGHKLIETHIPPTSNTSLSSSMSTSSGDETVLYDWRSMQADIKKSGGKENQKPPTEPKKEEKCEVVLPETAGMTDRELRLRLVELGESPGPISSRTRPTYMRRLCRLMKESNSQSPRQQRQTDQPQTDLGYTPELRLALRTFELPHCHADEQALCQQFDQADQNRKWREGVIKSCFSYLLLDPRVTKNLPFRSHTMSPQECFQTFVNAIFYVGKGKRSRPYSHLYEALEYHRGDKMSKKLCPKVQHILQVWNSQQGIISLHCFQNVIPVEAYTREACMVEAIGLKMLTNQKRGDFYGVVSNWPLNRKRELGIHLLYRAMHIFLAEGERQLRPVDIRQ
eukprot:XP_011613284.1 PREDICTED: uncharacterized protein LOC101065376 [Takifugu rubripes]